MKPSKGRLVRMPVPPVRPLLRRTIKRFLRLLPSILLLLFVVSLIFVTLMQIAVIHTHRRLQRNQNTVGNTVGGQQSTVAAKAMLLAAVMANNQSVPQHLAGVIQRQSTPTAVTPSIVATSGHQTTLNGVLSVKKTEVLRIEALLDKNLPSIETNSQVLQNFVNLGRIRQIIHHFSDDHNYNTPLVVKQTNNQSISNVLDMNQLLTNQLLFSVNHNNGVHTITTGDERQHNQRLANESHIVVNSFGGQLVIDGKHSNENVLISSPLVTTTHPFQSKSLCSAVPPNLVGRVRIESNVKIDENMSQVIVHNPDVVIGGFWEPTNCYARHRVAIIIPFRDRKHHLSILLYHLHPILKRQLLSYKIYVIEQFGNDTFNKGVLMNAGVREALKENDFHCFVFHDVDLIPEDDRNLYSCPFYPRHMSVAVDKFNYSLPYPGEDDDMAHRLKYHNLHIIRPPESIGRYTMIKHNHRPESPNNVRSALLRMAKRRAFRDGLGSVRYRVIFKRYERCYTHIMVEIGYIHKWHFPSPNKLVLHFK
ncbi:uncharacterized protein LOC128961827 isoform X2 [Oppia nitens]|uniref:uncharacterized protein LOC128961827 isoform X2 n=1 Tax=Oppia nitens TaxID=1686743 RepID=UPI0023DA2E6B|nr:uncharacterized protein LOC128961827 isoform X2 [Oppia nitens]